MELFGIFQVFIFVVVTAAILCTCCRLLFSFWLSPALVYRKLKKNGLDGPPPSFPLGNLSEMKKKPMKTPSGPVSNISHDLHSALLPYFSRWRKSYGKVFVYWLGTEPFLYIADPALLKVLSAEVTGKNWGKPAVFRRDRASMFGNGILMAEGDEWVRHRHVVTPAFNPTNLKAMASIMVETATKMLDNWSAIIHSGNQEIDVDSEISTTAVEIIAKTFFGITDHSGRVLFEKLRALQTTLFKSSRFVGVPFGQWLHPTRTLEARKLGQETNHLFMSLITTRRNSIGGSSPQHDLLGLLLKQSEQGGFTNALATQELVDECKTFFFGGHETTALSITWTMFLLAIHQEWQDQLREEIREVVAANEIDINMLAGLKKMEWVKNEVYRLYPSAPNAQRQAKADIQVSEDLTIPSGTNLWIDILGMHHDPTLWGEDVHEFKPERFRDDIHGGCKHKMGFLPFGFGGRTCIGRNFSSLEYKIVLTLILSRFSFTISPTYCHSLYIVLSLRPSYGLPLVLHPLKG